MEAESIKQEGAWAEFVKEKAEDDFSSGLSCDSCEYTPTRFLTARARSIDIKLTVI